MFVKSLENMDNYRVKMRLKRLILAISIKLLVDNCEYFVKEKVFGWFLS